MNNKMAVKTQSVIKGKSVRKWTFRIVSLLMSFMILAFTFIPSLDVKAFNTKDKNGNISLEANGDIKLNILVAAIDPTLTSIDNKNYWNGKKKIKASEYFGFSLDYSLNFWIDNFEEVSHNTVDINVVDKVVINEFPKYVTLKSLDNNSFQKIFKKDSYGYGDWFGGIQDPVYKEYDGFEDIGELDYEYYIDKLDLVNRKNKNEFDMVLIIGIDPLCPYETCMVGNSPSGVNGGVFYEDCDNFVIVTPTFSRQDGSIENVGHLAEHMIGYTYGMIDYEPRHTIDGSNYMALNDWQKFSLCELLGTSNSKVYGYGMVHYSPNSENDYDWINYTNEVKYYKDWKNGKNAQIFTPDVYQKDSFFNKYGDPTVNHHRWWFYNMPYEDGRDKDGYYNNWWRYIFNPNYVTGIEADTSYPLGEIKLNVGDSTAVKFKVEDQAYKSFTSDTKKSSAAVNIKDTSILSYSSGQIKAKKAGKTTITVKLDGKSVKYTVNVTDQNAQKEQVTAFVKRFYKVVLGRPQSEIDKDVNGINDWVNRLTSGQETGAQVAYGFVYSPEFQNKKVSNDEYVKTLYKSFFNRDPFDPNNLDEGGYNYWMNKLNSGTDRIDVLAGFTNSVEFKNLCDSYGITRGELDADKYRKPNNNQNQNNNPAPVPKKELKLDTTNVDKKKLEKFVSDLYTTTLGRSGEADGIEYWKGCILKGQDDKGRVYTISTVISKGFFLSQEYANKNKSDEEFVLDCYAAFFARNPVGTDDEVNYWNWVNKLKNKEITRQEMIEVGFGYSPEFKNLLTNEYGFVIVN